MKRLAVLFLTTCAILAGGCGRPANLPPDLRPIAVTGTYGVGFKVRGHGFWMVKPYSGLWLVDPYSGRLSQLLKTPGYAGISYARWSPGGERISFVKDDELCVLDVATKETKILGDKASINAWYDNDHILWVQRFEERDPDGCFLSRWRLMLTDMAGKSKVLLTSNDSIVRFASDAESGIVVYSTRYKTPSGDQKYKSSIFILSIEDGAHSEPSELKLDAPPVYAYPSHLLLGEGGKYLLYSVIVREGERPWRMEARIARLDGTKVLSSSEIEIPTDSAPTLQEINSEDMLFNTNDSDDWRLFLMTSGKRVYLSQPLPEGQIGWDTDWSRDGSLFTYFGMREVVNCPIPSTTIHIVDTSGKRLKELTLRQLAAYGIAW